MIRMRWLTVPVFFALTVGPSLAAIRGRALDVDESSPHNPNPNPVGGGGGGGGQTQPPPEVTETVPEKPPIQDRAYIVSRRTKQCVGDGDHDSWLDAKTSCFQGKQLQLAYTRDFHLRDANTGKCLDNMNTIYSNQKAYPKLRPCRSGSSQEFFFLRMPGYPHDYRILTVVQEKTLFAGLDHENDFVFEYFNSNCPTCQTFYNPEGAFDWRFFSDAWASYFGP